jgi:hypothetical protein
MKMRRIITLLLLTICSPLIAETLRAHYDVSFGILGKMGESDAILKKQNGRYTIDISMKATGMAKTLSKNRKERHHSEGIVRNGRLIFKRYDVIRSYGNKKIVKSYRADRKHRIIRKIYEKYKNGKRYVHKESVLPFFTNDDLLTLYFNLDTYIDKRKPGTYRFKAAGAERQKGTVVLIVPDAKHRKAYIDDLGTGATWYATAIINQKIFNSGEGRLELAVGKDGITQKALLKDVILFGDIVAVRKK